MTCRFPPLAGEMSRKDKGGANPCRGNPRGCPLAQPAINKQAVKRAKKTSAPSMLKREHKGFPRSRGNARQGKGADIP